MDMLSDFVKSEIGVILQSIVGALFVISVAAIGRLISNRPAKRVWRLILRDTNSSSWYNFIFRPKNSNKLYIVLPTIGSLSVGGFEQKTWQEIPQNINLILLQEALGISELIKTLSKIYGDLDVELCVAHLFHDYKSNFVTVGGPSVNSVTKDLLSAHNIDRQFEVLLPDHHIIDLQDEKIYIAQKNGNELIRDYGFTFIVKNPLYPSKYCVVCMGIWEFGTAAAIRMLLGADLSSPLFAKLLSLLRNGKNALIISQTEVQDLYCSPPKFVKVRECTSEHVREAMVNQDEVSLDEQIRKVRAVKNSSTTNLE